MRKITVGLNWAGDFNIDSIVEQAKIADDSGVHTFNILRPGGLMLYLF